MEGYYNAEMPGSRLNIRFHGNEKTPEQIFIMPFGDDVKYFVVGGVREGDRHVTRCGMVRIMGWGSADRISRGCLGGDTGRDAI